MFKHCLYSISVLLSASMICSAQVYMPLEIQNGTTQEMTSGTRVTVHGARTPISIPAAVGNGFRTDGYSSYIQMPINGLIKNNALGVNMKDEY